MRQRIYLGVVALLAFPVGLSAQQTSATYITHEEITAVNQVSGTDRQLQVLDMGDYQLAVGIIHRGPTEPYTGGSIRGIAHDATTEAYVVVSGAGTLVTGGHIADGRRSDPDGTVTLILNGPSNSGQIEGDEVVMRDVKEGDVIIIPAGVPHGWTNIDDHVDYLSIRPDQDKVLPTGYIHPVIQAMRQ